MNRTNPLSFYRTIDRLHFTCPPLTFYSTLSTVPDLVHPGVPSSTTETYKKDSLSSLTTSSILQNNTFKDLSMFSSLLSYYLEVFK